MANQDEVWLWGDDLGGVSVFCKKCTVKARGTVTGRKALQIDYIDPESGRGLPGLVKAVEEHEHD